MSSRILDAGVHGNWTGGARKVDAEESTDFEKRRCRTRLYWAADVGSVAGSGGDASLSLAGLDVSASAVTGGVEEAIAVIGSAGSSVGSVGAASAGVVVEFSRGDCSGFVRLGDGVWSLGPLGLDGEEGTDIG